MVMRSPVPSVLADRPVAGFPAAPTYVRYLIRRSWLQVIATWIARSRQRRDLADLSDHLLKDIGLTRAQAAREAAKPFWR